MFQKTFEVLYITTYLCICLDKRQKIMLVALPFQIHFERYFR